MSDWMGDTPQTVMTTRAPAVLKTTIRAGSETKLKVLDIQRFSMESIPKYLQCLD